MANRIQQSIDNYRLAKAEMEKSDRLLMESLVLAMGYTLGSEMPGMSAAIYVAAKRLFPDYNFPEIR